MAVIMRKPFIFAIILVISFILNLFLIGLVSGLYLQHPFQKDIPRPSAWFFHPPTILKALPETRTRLTPILHRNAPFVHEKIKKLRQAQRAIQQQMGLDNLDKVSLEKAFSQLRQAELEKSIVVHQVFIEALGQLTTTERQQLKALLPDLTHSRRGRHRHDKLKLPDESQE
jgi:uncharacterized membrane protein